MPVDEKAPAVGGAADDLSHRAGVLRRLHVPGDPLVLPNVWDVTSALAVTAAGYPVVATSSAAVAGSLGYPDGQGAPAGEMFAAATRIGRAVTVPLTVDAEAGYGLMPGDLLDSLLTAGAVGCNLEDTDHLTGGMCPVGQQVEYLAALREAANATGVDIVINARIDCFLNATHGVGNPFLLEEAISRATQYLAAGADCVYPIMLHEPALAAQFCRAVSPGPVNLLGSSNPATGRISLIEAADVGAARVSFGPDLWRAATRALKVLIPPPVRTDAP